jgi:hypothetical protein
MNALQAKRDGEHVAITMRIGDKRARFKVTRKYARDFAADVLAAAMDEGDAELDSFLRALRGATEDRARERAKDFLGHLKDLLSGKGGDRG